MYLQHCRLLGRRSFHLRQDPPRGAQVDFVEAGCVSAAQRLPPPYSSRFKNNFFADV